MLNLTETALLPAERLPGIDTTQARRTFRQLQHLWTHGADAMPNPIAGTVPVLDALAESGYQCYAVIDMLTQQYMYLSPNQEAFTGCPLSEVYEGGMAWLFERIHPDDLQPLVAMNEAKWEFYRAMPEAERPHFRANFDFRVRNLTGLYRRIQQQSLCLRHTPAGLPHVILAQLVDITHFKPIDYEAQSERPSLLLTIQTGGTDHLVLQCFGDHCIKRKKPLLTPRELEVLRMLDQGFSTRSIASQLKLSNLTVNTQRRNMLYKTGVVDTTALVSYARLLGWL